MALTAAESAALTAAGQAVGNHLGGGSSGSPSTSSDSTISESGGSGSGQISAEGRATRLSAYEQLIEILGDTSYSRDSAIKDSEGAVADLFKQYSITDLPKIYSNQTSTGGYNSTGHQLLANDAFSSTVAKGAALRQKAITDYANARNTQLAPLISLLNGDKETFNEEFGYTVKEGNTTGASGAGGSSTASDAAATAAAVATLFA